MPNKNIGNNKERNTFLLTIWEFFVSSISISSVIFFSTEAIFIFIALISSFNISNFSEFILIDSLLSEILIVKVSFLFDFKSRVLFIFWILFFKRSICKLFPLLFSLFDKFLISFLRSFNWLIKLEVLIFFFRVKP